MLQQFSRSRRQAHADSSDLAAYIQADGRNVCSKVISTCMHCRMLFQVVLQPPAKAYVSVEGQNLIRRGCSIDATRVGMRREGQKPKNMHLDGEDVLDRHGEGLVESALGRGHVLIHRLHELQDLLLAQRVVLALERRQCRSAHDRDLVAREPAQGRRPFRLRPNRAKVMRHQTYSQRSQDACKKITNFFTTATGAEWKNFTWR